MTIKQFFAAGPASIKGLINSDELLKSVVTGVGAASLVGLAIAVLTAINTHASAIFTNPTAATLATALIGLLLDVLRRQAGGKLSVVAPPVDAPASVVAVVTPHDSPAEIPATP